MQTAFVFDLDDTLCDYQAVKMCAQNELSILLKSLDIDVKAYWKLYTKIEPVLFKQYVNHDIALEVYQKERFLKPLKYFLDCDVSYRLLVFKMNKIYMNCCNHKVKLFKEVKDTLLILKKCKSSIFILTNGPTNGQTAKIKALELDQIVDDYFISEQIGYAKPDPRAFYYVQKKIKFKNQNILMIGDSLNDDYVGASKAGITAILINRKSKRYSSNIITINSLTKLLKLPFF